MLLVGTETTDQSKSIELDEKGLLSHTLVVGQSGSGKSFFVSRLIEEILLKTRARVVVLDPNGDFRNLHRPSTAVWERQGAAFERMSQAVPDGDPDFDSQATFQEAWEARRFTFLSPGLIQRPSTDHVLHRRLVLHWDSIGEDLRSFLLRTEPEGDAKVLLGIEAVTKFARWQVDNRPEGEFGFDLRAMQVASEQFGLRNLGLRQYDYVKGLSTDDWYAVRAKIADLVTRHNKLWWSRDRFTPIPPAGLAEYVEGGFTARPESDLYWDSLVLSLDTLEPHDSLLTAEVALTQLWNQAKAGWRRRVEAAELGREAAEILPTFVIVDEAHNFVPERNTNPLRARVADRIMQIASEGRKYGLYLILATQRPTKLNAGLVPECENACVMRVQSEMEVEFASRTLGIPTTIAPTIPSFRQGRGLLVGRWVGNPLPKDSQFAPARIEVGGGGVAEDWAQPRALTPAAGRAEATATYMAALSSFVQTTLEESPTATTLVDLANMTMEEFGRSISRENDWLGHGSFADLVEALQIEGLRVNRTPPGFAWLHSVHDEPKVSVTSVERPTLPEAGRDLLLLAHQYIRLPLVGAQVFHRTIELIASELLEDEYDMARVSKAVRDRSRDPGPFIARSTVDFVLRGIGFGGHSFETSSSQTPGVLADAFQRGVRSSLEKEGFVVSASDWAPVADYVTGGWVTDQGRPSTFPTPADFVSGLGGVAGSQAAADGAREHLPAEPPVGEGN